MDAAVLGLLREQHLVLAPLLGLARRRLRRSLGNRSIVRLGVRDRSLRHRGIGHRSVRFGGGLLDGRLEDRIRLRLLDAVLAPRTAAACGARASATGTSAGTAGAAAAWAAGAT